MKNIPYSHQSICQDDIKEVVKVLKSGWITQGPKIARFERCLCDYAGVKYAVAVSSGTSALHIAALAAGLKAGDEVITSPITFVASANCALYCGARPVFADVDAKTANIDPSEIVKSVSRRTRIILPVHFAGNPCDLLQIRRIAKKYGLIVIEDVAHALGATYKGFRVGGCRYSDMTILSFHPVKAITTGEGGAVLTNSRDLYERLNALRSHGIIKGRGLQNRMMADCGWYYEMQELGYNYRITDIQAALGASQLKKLNNFVGKRRNIASIYDEAFSNNGYFDTPVESERARSAYHLYPIRLKDKFVPGKEKIFRALRKSGLGVQVHYIPLYSHPYYARLGYKNGTCPRAEDYYRRAISLPLYPAMTKREVGYVTTRVLDVFSEACAL
jgi:UDP-4-amino-4,6-dideoxy-N-acetyl-beta-L-altrosamine transaminase